MQRININHKTLVILFGAFTSLNCLLFLLLLSSTVSALTYGSDFSLKYDINSTLDVSLSTNTGFIISDLSASNSAYSNTVTITVNSNASDGYVLSATVGKTSDNNRNNNKLVHTNNTNYFEGLATNASVTLSNLGSDKWGYSTYDDTNEVWSNYSGLATVGNTGTTLITSTTPGTKSIDMKIGASASSTQISGTFTNDINFTATANVVTYDYSITYNANNSSTVTNMPTNVSSASFNTGDSVQLSSTTPSASNAISFLGWCDGTVSGTTCTGTLYQPGDYLKFANASSSTTNAVSLTGVWELNIITIASGGNLQDISSKTEGGCPATLTTGQAYTLTDARDGASYRVARLADGNCWMLDNLALDITAVSLNDLKGNTNAEDITLEYLKGTRTGTTSDQYPIAAVSKTWSSSSQDYYNVPMIAVDSTTSGICDSGYCVNSDKSWSYDDITPVSVQVGSTPVTSTVQGKVGIYYNYCATSAGSYCWKNGQPSTDPDPNSYQDVKEDICPRGWRLPIGDNAGTSTGEFETLYAQYNGSNPNQLDAFEIALSTPLSGRFHNGKAYDQAEEGYWWTSTWLTSISYTDMLITCVRYSTIFSSNISYPKYYGFSIRCILN